MSPSWVVFAHLIIDDIYLPDGTTVTGCLGGAGSYAALGAALAATGGVALVSGVGRDLAPAHYDWLRSTGIDTSALVVRGEKTPRSKVRYHTDGTRDETPLFGEEHFVSMDPTIADLPADWTTVDGAYFFGTHDAWQWPWLRSWASRLLWEISAESCRAGQFTSVAARLADVDILSINLAEAQDLCGLHDPVACAAALRAAGAALVVLRMGADGALIATEEDTLAVHAAPCPVVVDPTGAGNCYSGAFLAAYTRTGDAEHAAAQAAKAAATVLGGYGLPPRT